MAALVGDPRTRVSVDDLRGLVTSADGDGYLFLHDVSTGAVLFKTRLPAPVQGSPMSYLVDGKQYLAIPVGGGRVAGSANTLFVFAIPEG